MGKMLVDGQIKEALFWLWPLVTHDMALEFKLKARGTSIPSDLWCHVSTFLTTKLQPSIPKALQVLLSRAAMLPGRYCCLCQPGLKSCLKERRDLLLTGDERLEEAKDLKSERTHLRYFALSETVYMPIL